MRIFAVLLISIFFVSGQARAGVLDKVNDAFNGRTTLRMRVVDSAGKPVPAVTIWSMIPNGKSEINEDLMFRLVRRYGADFDFIQFADAPIGQLGVGLADNKGIYTESHADVSKWHKSDGFEIVFAVLKRGYRSVITTYVVPKGGERDVTVVLEQDPAARIDPLMFDFDLLRAQAHDRSFPAKNIMREGWLNADLDAIEKIRLLADGLRNNKKFESASAVYYGLAYMPSVKSITLSDGSRKIIGYSNGFDSSDPQRVSDLGMARSLNSSVPYVVIGRWYASNIGNKAPVDVTKQEHRYIVELVEGFIASDPDRVWPISYNKIVDSYIALGAFDKACSALRRAFKFEPVFRSMTGLFGWEAAVTGLNKMALAANYSGEMCVLK